MSRLLVLLAVLLVAVAVCSASPMKLYKKMPGANKYRQVLVAVSSTVIPLDDLPTYTVSSLLGPASEAPPPGVAKPEYPTKLITANRKKTSFLAKKPSVVEIGQGEYSED